MSALQRSTLAFRRLANQPAVQRRGLATSNEPQVTWSQYRSGEKSLSEWVDANRARVAFGFFVFYCSLAAWNLRPKKAKKAPETKEQPAPASK